MGYICRENLMKKHVRMVKKIKCATFLSHRFMILKNSTFGFTNFDENLKHVKKKGKMEIVINEMEKNIQMICTKRLTQREREGKITKRPSKYDKQELKYASEQVLDIEKESSIGRTKLTMP